MPETPPRPLTTDPDLCDRCGGKGQVIDSRPDPHGLRRRRHKCRVCGHRWVSEAKKVTLH